MALIALFSDLHLHAYREFSEILPSGLNSRLKDGLDVLGTVIARAKSEADVLLFAGDFYHKRRVIDVRVQNEAHDRLAMLRGHGVATYLMRGNHDQATRDGTVHSIHALQTLVTKVVDYPGIEEVHPGVFVNFIPYMDDPEAIKKALKAPRPAKAKTYLCLGHFGVLGASTGPVEYVPLEPILIDDLPDDVYDFGFLGHYHRRQKLKDRWWYIGSPLQTTRGERGESKGYLTYDTTVPGKFTVHPLRMPEFVTITQEDIENGTGNTSFVGKVKGNFVDVMLDDEPEGGIEEFKKFLMKLKCRGANVVCSTKEERAAVRLDVHPGLSPVEMVERYVAAYGGELDPEAVVGYAKACLEEAEKDS